MAEERVLQIPLGFRFRPTNREVVRYFLWPKIFGRPRPTYMIQEADVYAHHPDQLTAAFRPAPSLLQEWWFFARATPKNSSGDRRCRMTPFGRWVITQKALEVTDDDEHDRQIGKKGSLSFQVKCDGRWVKTSWLMEEFSCRDLEPLRLAAEHYPAAQCDTSWVVCRIYPTPSARTKPSSAGKRKMEEVPSTSLGYSSVHDPSADFVVQDVPPTSICYGSVHDPSADFVVEDVPSTSYGYGSVHDPSTDFVEMSGLPEPLPVDWKGKGKMKDVPSTSYGYGSVHDQSADFVVEDVPSASYGYGSVHDPSTDFVEMSDPLEPLSVDSKGKGKNMVTAADNQGASNGGLMPLDTELSSGLHQGHGTIPVEVEEIAMEQVWADVDAANSDGDGRVLHDG